MRIGDFRSRSLIVSFRSLIAQTVSRGTYHRKDVHVVRAAAASSAILFTTDTRLLQALNRGVAQSYSFRVCSLESAEVALELA